MRYLCSEKLSENFVFEIVIHLYLYFELLHLQKILFCFVLRFYHNLNNKLLNLFVFLCKGCWNWSHKLYQTSLNDNFNGQSFRKKDSKAVKIQKQNQGFITSNTAMEGIQDSFCVILSCNHETIIWSIKFTTQRLEEKALRWPRSWHFTTCSVNIHSPLFILGSIRRNIGANVLSGYSIVECRLLTFVRIYNKVLRN